ncbi:hypothetical protein [Microbacterium sp.]|uniref:hypothetical protein n=1 Tax=Microbacterium sp. TaxID=51671 RepID=UPI003F9D9E0F
MNPHLVWRIGNSKADLADQQARDEGLQRIWVKRRIFAPESWAPFDASRSFRQYLDPAAFRKFVSRANDDPEPDDG